MKTYNVKLKVEENDKIRLTQTLEAHRECVNFCSEFLFGKKTISIIELHSYCYRSFRIKNPEVPSQVVIRAEHEARAQYRTIRSNRHKILKPIEMKKLAMRLDKRICTFKNRGVKLTAIGGKRIFADLVWYPKLEEMFTKYAICDPLIFKKNDELWLSITFDTPKPMVFENKAVGIDLGIKRIAATSEGKIFKIPGFNARKRQIRYLKRSLKSKGTKSARRHLKKVCHKERNLTKNTVHVLSNELLKTNASILVLEDLSNIKKNPKNKYKKKFNNKQSQIPYYLIRQTLTYKAQTLAKRVVTVKPYFTSQDDFRGLPPGKRIGSRYYAHDKVMLDADLNAANNIVIKSKLPVSCCKALDGQAIVTSPNVRQSFRHLNKSSIVS